MKFELGLILFLSGCATVRPPGAKMVSMTLKPTKSGIVRLDGKWVESKKAADSLMLNFCAPQRAEIVRIDNATIAVGASSTTQTEKILGQNYNFTDTDLKTKTLPIVHFNCVDGKDPGLEKELD